PVKSEPMIFTSVPPLTDPDAGAIESTSGTGWTSALSSISLPETGSRPGTVAPSNGVGKIVVNAAPGAAANPSSSVLLVGSTGSRSPALIGRLVLNVPSPVLAGNTPLLVATAV